MSGLKLLIISLHGNFFISYYMKNHIIGTPGVVFGSSGDGYMRFTGFSSREDILLALERIRKGV